MAAAEVLPGRRRHGSAARASRWRPIQRAHNLLTNYLTNVNVRTLARAVAATGWYGLEFVFPDGPIGVAGAERVILQTTNLIDHAYNIRGTLDEWKHEIARLAVGNPLLILAVSVAFASALIGPCQYESGGVHYVGKSSRGKTSTLIAAGSVWGGGSRGYHRQWRATANGLEGTAALHNNALQQVRFIDLPATRAPMGCLIGCTNLRVPEISRITFAMPGRGSTARRAVHSSRR
ncbi:MAG: DUF927 domain-containing protein [Methylocella sp.]